MKFYNGTGCVVFLVGNLRVMPAIEQNYSHDMVISVSRQNISSDQIENYRVIINSVDAYRLLKHGFVGMSVSIRGDLRVNGLQTEIVAEKIDFNNLPTKNQFDQTAVFFQSH